MSAIGRSEDNVADLCCGAPSHAKYPSQHRAKGFHAHRLVRTLISTRAPTASAYRSIVFSVGLAKRPQDSGELGHGGEVLSRWLAKMLTRITGQATQTFGRRAGPRRALRCAKKHVRRRPSAVSRLSCASRENRSKRPVSRGSRRTQETVPGSGARAVATDRINRASSLFC